MESLPGDPFIDNFGDEFPYNSSGVESNFGLVDCNLSLWNTSQFTNCNEYGENCTDIFRVTNCTENDARNKLIPDQGLTQINMTQLICYSILLPFAAVGNILVFVSLFKSRHRKSRVNLMILHLSLADMIVAFIFLPTEIVWNVTIQWTFGNVACKIYKFVAAFGFYLSSMVLVCISLDRYFAVLHPLKVNDAQRRGKLMLLFAWVISGVISIPQSIIFSVLPHPEFAEFQQCVTFSFFMSKDLEMTYTIFCISFLYFIPLGIIIVAYVRIITEISKNRKDNHGELSPGEPSRGRLPLRRSNVSNIERARTRTLRMTFIIVMAFVWCWTPYAMATLWNFIDEKTFNSMNRSFQDIFFIIAVSNSVVNPIIYGRYSIVCCTDSRSDNLCRGCEGPCRYCCLCCWLQKGHQYRLAGVPMCNGSTARTASTRTFYTNSTRDKVTDLKRNSNMDTLPLEASPHGVLSPNSGLIGTPRMRESAFVEARNGRQERNVDIPLIHDEYSSGYSSLSFRSCQDNNRKKKKIISKHYSC